MYASYDARSISFDRLRRFVSPDAGWVLWKGLASAALYAAVSTWIGLGFGRWMRGVQR
jgi:type IV secretory pathway TrbD component